MQRMSGIATLTNEFVQAVTPKAKSKKGKPPPPSPKSSTPARPSPASAPSISTPSAAAEALNHRLDLQDGILIKNNHISLGGGLPAVLAKALEGRKPGQIVQVEVRTPQELQQAIAGGPTPSCSTT